MEETRPFVSWDLVHDFMVDVFVKYGVPEEDARICTDVLLESDRRGIKATAATASSLFTWIVLKTAPCCRKPKLKLSRILLVL